MAPRTSRKNKQAQKQKAPGPPRHNPFADLAQELSQLVREPSAQAELKVSAAAPVEPELSELSDEAAFAAAMQGAVTPLTSASARVTPVRDAPNIAVQQVAQDHFEQQLFAAFDRPCWRSDQPDPLEEDLMRGALPVEKTVDLHGLHLQLALDRVKATLGQARHARQRVVRVIHGKGLHSEYGDAVLRQQVRKALSKPPLSNIICAWVEALEAEGGAGVTDVLLRRR